MAKTWLVTASQDKARIFQYDEKNQEVEMILTLDNPLGRERNKSLQRHKPGVTMVRGHSYSGAPHNYSKHTDPHEEVAVEFSKKVCSYLEAERQRRVFGDLVVAAEPKFLGRLKKAMKVTTRKKVKSWLAKDLNKLTVSRLSTYLKKNQD